MKIVAIRGRNLASLAGDFAIELDRPPLADVGVFAITGPTGAGKTSLLDAMCVALFDRTPRLQTRGGVLIGRAGEDDTLRLPSNDVRSLLRRGAGAGHAEVEFIGRDGHRYRSRWSVRRARNRAEGRFQASTMELLDLDSDEALGGTKSETLAAISDRLGLSFEQFTRSALLAQGDFSAFLEANARERAELLERMTGTQIYGALSIAAHRRAADEQRALAALLSDIDKIQLLDDDARAAAEGELAQLGKQVERVRARFEAARRVADADSSTARLSDERAQLAAAATAAAEGERAARDAASAAAERHERAQQALEAARPELDRATELDSRVAQAAQEAAAAAEADERARRAAEQATAVVTRIEREVETARSAVAEAAAWLEAHASLAPLVADWGLARKELVAYADAVAAATAHDRERQRRGEVLEQARATVAVQAAREQAGRHAMKCAEQELADADARTAAHPTEALRAQLETIEARREALNEVAAAHDNAARLRDEIDAAGRERADARRDGKLAAEQAAESAAERVALTVRLDEAESALERARAAHGFEEHRAELVEGQECPLCGATEHPYAGTDAVIAALADEQRQRVAQLRTQLTSVERAEAAATARSEELEERAAAAARSARRQKAELKKIEAWYAEASADGALRGIALAAAVADAEVGPLLEAVDGEREAVRVRQAEGDRLAVAAGDARAAVDARRAEWLAAKDAHTEADRAAQAAAVALRDSERAAQAERATAERALRALAPLFERRDGWRDALTRDSAAFGAACAAEVEAWQACTLRREQAAARVAEQTAALAEARATAAARAQGARELTERRDQRTRVLVDLREARAGIFEGRATAAVRAQLDEGVRVAAAAATAATGAREQASVQHARALTKMQEADGKLAALAQERAAAAEAFGEGEPVLAEVERERDEVEAGYRERAVKLGLDDEARKTAGALRERVVAQRAVVDVWGSLAELIGSSDGKKFRVFAQSLTLDALLAHANRHLLELAPRYRLVRVPGYDLDLQVVDRDLGDEVRSVNSLSGGETFLVSLALALALSSVSARDTQVDSLLIDEGFGTLDPETLEVALATLDTLQATGRKVGLISHVPGLAERIGVQVQVTPRGAGRSTVRVVAG